MPGPLGTASGIVSRGLPQPAPDLTYRESRFGRYGSQIVEPLFATKHAVCDEGSYFTAADSAGRATAAAPTAFSDTVPLAAILNTDVASNPAAKRIYLDYLRAVETAAGTAGTSFFLRVELDVIARYTSGGTTINGSNSNQDSGVKSVGQLIVLPTTSAITASGRTITSNACVLPTLTAPIAVGSEWAAYFGGDGAKFFAASTTFGWAGSSLAPLVIGPQQAIVFPFQITLQSAASSWQLEAGWWER